MVASSLKSLAYNITLSTYSQEGEFMFRRPLGRPLRRALVGNVPPALQRANQLMANGHYAEAAEIFEQFARGAQSRNGPRAPWFFLEAGQARLLAGQTPVAMAHYQQGLAIFAARGQVQKLYNSGMRVVTALKARNLAVEAKQIEDYLKTTLPGGFQTGPAGAIQKPRVLPINCPGCGGPIRSDEVEWADELTAECPYCGSGIRAE
jgi:tetratricopeptide (TPR) repeat protein